MIFRELNKCSLHTISKQLNVDKRETGAFWRKLLDRVYVKAMLKDYLSH